MIGSMMILAMATFGQLPGADTPGPNPTAVVSKPGDPPKAWLTAVSPIDGRHIQLYGWMEGANVRYRPEENPQLYAQPKPTAQAPAQPAGPARPKVEAQPNQTAPTGVIVQNFPHTRPGGAWYGGNTGPEAEASVKLKRPDVYLTVIGPQRKATLERLRADPAMAGLVDEMGERLAIHGYDADNPIVSKVRLPAGGRPDIIIQDSTGKEVARHRDDPGPATIVKEIRRADPHYRPGNDEAANQETTWNALMVTVAILAVLAIIRAKVKT